MAPGLHKQKGMVCMSKKKFRRALKRIALRKEISYSDAIKNHFNVDSLDKVNKSVVYSLHKGCFKKDFLQKKPPKKDSLCTED